MQELKRQSQDGWCLDRDSNRTPPEYSSRLLPLNQARSEKFDSVLSYLFVNVFVLGGQVDFQLELFFSFIKR
jgi:hypothetical protein